MIAARTRDNSFISRLMSNLRRSSTRLEAFRARRLAFLSQYVGPHYGGTSSSDLAGTGYDRAKAEPLNTVNNYARVMVPQLFSRDMRAEVTSRRDEYAAFARVITARLNLLMEEIALATTIRRAVMAAMSGPGLLKCGIEHRPESAHESWLHDPGLPFVDNVSLDSYILDPDCKSREAAQFEGDEFDMARADALEEFDPGLIERLTVSHYEGRGTETKAESLAKTTGGLYSERLIPMLRLAQVWLPREGVVLTVPGGRLGDQEIILREESYTGAEGGPYEMLGFDWPDDCALPLPPFALIYDLHLVQNTLARKVQRQAERAKTITVAEPAAEADAQTVRDAGDGGVVLVQNVDRLKELTFGGADPRTYEAMAFFEAWQSRIGGNTNVAGGLKSMARTLGQEQMMLSQASLPILEARGQVFALAKRVCARLGKFLWEERHPVMDTMVSVPLEVGGSIPVQWGPQREGTFWDYDWSVDVFTLAGVDPEVEYQTALQIVTQIILPLAPLMAQQGVTVQVQELVHQLARKRNVRGVGEWFREAMPVQVPVGVEAGGGVEEAGAPEDRRLSQRPVETVSGGVPGRGVPVAREMVAAEAEIPEGEAA